MALSSRQSADKRARRTRIRLKALSNGRPRLSVFRSSKNIYAQVIDDAQGVTFAVPKQTEVKISGIDKQLVGETAAKIRRIRPPEPYKGKGVRYAGEKVRRKEGKKK